MSFLSNIFSPPASNVNLPTNYLPYNPSSIAPTQASMLGGIGGLSQYNLGGTNLGQGQNIGQGMINDPNAAAYIGGAGTAGAMGMGAATNMYNMGGMIENMGLDPQSALYNRTLGQVTDQARANAAASGLSTSPVGLSATDWATNNFNIDWQNQQLQRAIMGGQAGGQMQAGAAPLYMQSAGMPWQAGQQVGGANLGTLSNLGALGIQASQIPGQQIAGWQQGLGMMGNLQNQSIQQQQQNAQLALQQNQMAFNQQQAMMGGLGKVLGGVGGFALGGLPGAAIGSSMFGGGGSGTSGSGWGGANFSGMNSSPFGGWQPQMSGFAPSFFGSGGSLTGPPGTY